MTRAAAPLCALVLAVLYLLPWSAHLGDFPAHMLRHMGLVAVAAPLLVLAWPKVARRAGLSVVPAAAFEFVVVWVWHLPDLHGWAQAGGVAFALEQALFLAAGWAVWSSALTTPSPLTGSGGLFLTSIHMTMLGALLVLAPGDLYAEVCGRAPDLSGQQLGGMLMLAIGTPVYLFGALWLARRGLQGGTA